MDSLRNLLLGLTPDYSGRLPAAHVQRYTELGDWIRSCYGAGNILAELLGVQVQANSSVVLRLNSTSQAITTDRLWLMEELRDGQKISAYTIELLESDDESSGGSTSADWARPQNWLFPCSTVGTCAGSGGGPQGGGAAPWLPALRRVAAFNDSSVGHKRVVKLCSNATAETPALQRIQAVRVNFTAVAGDGAATLRSLAVFGAAGCA